MVWPNTLSHIFLLNTSRFQNKSKNVLTTKPPNVANQMIPHSNEATVLIATRHLTINHSILHIVDNQSSVDLFLGLLRPQKLGRPTSVFNAATALSRIRDRIRLISNWLLEPMLSSCLPKSASSRLGLTVNDEDDDDGIRGRHQLMGQSCRGAAPLPPMCTAACICW